MWIDHSIWTTSTSNTTVHCHLPPSGHGIQCTTNTSISHSYRSWNTIHLHLPPSRLRNTMSCDVCPQWSFLISLRVAFFIWWCKSEEWVYSHQTLLSHFVTLNKHNTANSPTHNPFFLRLNFCLEPVTSELSMSLCANTSHSYSGRTWCYSRKTQRSYIITGSESRMSEVPF